jgi:SET domain-containing protein
MKKLYQRITGLANSASVTREGERTMLDTIELQYNEMVDRLKELEGSFKHDPAESKLFYVKKSSEIKGRGLFAKEAIETDVVINVSDLLLFTTKETMFIEKTNAVKYIFAWYDRKNYDSVLVVSEMSFANHSYEPNARYDRDYVNQKMIFKSIKRIEKDDEITINYNHDPKCKDKLWFETE